MSAEKCNCNTIPCSCASLDETKRMAWQAHQYLHHLVGNSSFSRGTHDLPPFEVKDSILEPNKQKAGKLRHSLLMQTAINELIRVREFGVIKYPDPESWKKVATIDYFDAIHRHLAAWQSGEKRADDSGLHHMAHVMCNAMLILGLELEN